MCVVQFAEFSRGHAPLRAPTKVVSTLLIRAPREGLRLASDWKSCSKKSDFFANYVGQILRALFHYLARFVEAQRPE
ncbi:hypothetical protein H7I41_12895 [Mycobacterium manitobense]|uniref:Uncharacterized protein n=1 Tax=[Mycobacterium] manitobense TaxID=190147 RepID=A0A9X2YME3_9MYCO|nr:hypothetical protein [[Mycobacterium] manitobense]MCV7170810.1 hypothetical protein [[Mycobacterium] manitobense]